MPRKFNHERAATILAEAALIGDEKAADNHGVSVRSIQNWRARLKRDPVLVESFTAKTQAATTDWADGLGDTIKAGIDFLRRAANQVNPMDPDAIFAVVGAVKVLAELEMTRKVLDARLAGQNRQQPAQARKMATHRQPAQ